jgi:hypothetical protein
MDAEGFIRDHVQQLVRAHPMPEFLSMPYHENAEIKQNLDTLPQELKGLFHRLFNSDKSKISLKEVLPFKAKKGSVPYCHRMLTPKTECNTIPIKATAVLIAKITQIRCYARTASRGAITKATATFS